MKGVKNWLWKVEEGREGKDGEPSVGPVYRHISSKDGLSKAPDGISTCWQTFSESVKKYPKNRLLGRRHKVDGKAGPYVWQTFEEVYEMVVPLGAALRAVGVKAGVCCGIYGANSPEWFMAMKACDSQSAICVPLYDSLGENAVEFILNHAECCVVFAHEVKISLVLQSLPRCSQFVKSLVSFGGYTAEQKAEAEVAGVAVYSWEEFLELGRKNPADFVLPKSDDVCTIMYTSGTTGEPKGVVVKHENLLDVIVAVENWLVNDQLSEKDTFLSYLPLAHVFDRTVEEFFVMVGGRIGYWQGDVKFLLDDLTALQPTVFVGVPRVFERIHAGVSGKIKQAGGWKKLLFDFGYNTKLSNLKKGYKQSEASPLFDKLLFNKVKQAFGGKLRYMLSSAAPLPVYLEEFLRTTSCCYVVQGYGLTETCAGTFIAMPDVVSMAGTVGPPMLNIETRLVSVPEMGYDALGEMARGEICVKSVSTCSGYHRRPDLTKEAIVDGWFHTGDIGEWQPDGSMKIIDRKKNIFKLSQGEYVAVENLENIFEGSTVVDSIWVYGNSFESMLVAVVVPNKECLGSWAKRSGVAGDYETLCQHPEAVEFVLSELSAVAKRSKLKGFEAIKAVHLESAPLDMERDLITPTFKKKRPQLLKFYQTVIDSLYQQLKKS